MMAEGIFQRDTKNTVGQGGQWGKNHTDVFKAYVLKIFFIEKAKAIEIGIFL